jgi:hypothetical protein
MAGALTAIRIPGRVLRLANMPVVCRIQYIGGFPFWFLDVSSSRERPVVKIDSDPAGSASAKSAASGSAMGFFTFQTLAFGALDRSFVLGHDLPSPPRCDRGRAV